MIQPFMSSAHVFFWGRNLSMLKDVPGYTRVREVRVRPNIHVFFSGMHPTAAHSIADTPVMDGFLSTK